MAIVDVWPDGIMRHFHPGQKSSWPWWIDGRMVVDEQHNMDEWIAIDEQHYS